MTYMPHRRPPIVQQDSLFAAGAAKAGLERPEGRHPDDWYVTPRGLAAAALDMVVGETAATVLDAGAGTGSLGLDAVEARGPHPCAVTAVEIDADRAGTLPDDWTVVVADFMSWASDQAELIGGDNPEHPGWDLVISNPPFRLWLDFAIRCLSLRAKGKGHVLLLGRSAVLSGKARYHGLWRLVPPTHVIHMVRRPSFTPDGGTDRAQEYAWIHWGPQPTTSTKTLWLA